MKDKNIFLLNKKYSILLIDWMKREKGINKILCVKKFKVKR